MAGRGRLRREARRALSRFRNTSPAGLATTAWRAIRLAVRDPRRPSLPDRDERIVVSLTTVPSRIRGLAPVLRSLIDQSEPADRIVLALPAQSLKGVRYPDRGELDLPAGIDVIACPDHGPATKLLPALDAEPNAILIVVDDDVLYPRRFIETLLREHRRRPHAALGFRGVCIEPGVRFPDLDHVLATGVSATTPVDVLFGTWGYLVPPGALDRAVHDFSQAPEGMRYVDDVWISGHLARAGVLRFVVRASELPLETPSSLRDALTSGVNRSGANDEMALKHFSKDW